MRFTTSLALVFALSIASSAGCSYPKPNLDEGEPVAGAGGEAGQGGQAGAGAGSGEQGGATAQGGASGAGQAGKPPVVCSSGQQIACACPGTPVNGVQVCKEDGTGFGPCEGCPTGAGGTGGGAQGGTGAQGGSSQGGSSAQGGTGAQGGSLQGGTGGSGAQGGGDPFGGGGTGAGGGVPTNDCDACIAQAQSPQGACAKQVELCSANADCSAASACIGGCGPNDQACVDACVTAHEQGTAMLLAAQVCACEKGCSAQCSFCPGAAPQNGSCAHSICKGGNALKPTCSPCVAAVCKQDPFCCDAAKGAWDITCILQLDLSCGCYGPYDACLAKKVWSNVEASGCDTCLAAQCADATQNLLMKCDLQTVSSQCKALCGDDAACGCTCQHGKPADCGDAIAIFDSCAANNCAKSCN